MNLSFFINIIDRSVQLSSSFGKTFSFVKDACYYKDKVYQTAIYRKNNTWTKCVLIALSIVTDQVDLGQSAELYFVVKIPFCSCFWLFQWVQKCLTLMTVACVLMVAKVVLGLSTLMMYLWSHRLWFLLLTIILFVFINLSAFCCCLAEFIWWI